MERKSDKGANFLTDLADRAAITIVEGAELVDRAVESLKVKASNIALDALSRITYNGR